VAGVDTAAQGGEGESGQADAAVRSPLPTPRRATRFRSR
jgi:hypothetical protein